MNIGLWLSCRHRLLLLLLLCRVWAGRTLGSGEKRGGGGVTRAWVDENDWSMVTIIDLASHFPLWEHMAAEVAKCLIILMPFHCLVFHVKFCLIRERSFCLKS